MPQLLPADALQFVTERHLASLSTHGRGDQLHTVPVGFTYADGVVRVITFDGSQKVRNVERNPAVSICQIDGARWITFVGSAEVVRDAASVAAAEALYARRYRPPRPNPRRVVLRVSVERVLASAGLRQP